MSKPKYHVGQIVVYDSPLQGERLLQITNRFGSFFASFYNGRGFKHQPYYDGMQIEISKTNSKTIPLAPKFVTGLYTIPESNLRPLEKILA
ncbi:hypothetical protein HY449_01215 [Candidatus Pacearchaeota archaeon]|nr:hypothetical protein [Candidatus Pacearchaeota archaeon]